MYGLGEQIVNNNGGDNDDVERYHKQDEHKREPPELTGVFALAFTLLRRGRRLYSIQVVEVWSRIFEKHKRAPEVICQSPIKLRKDTWYGYYANHAEDWHAFIISDNRICGQECINCFQFLAISVCASFSSILPLHT